MKTRMMSPRSKAAGFNLLELMVTVAIVAILATIAYSSYSNQVRKSRRTEAKTALLDMAGREERYFSTANAYSSTPTDLGYSTGTNPITVGNGYYEITISGVAAGPPPTYTLKATPVAGSTQTKDKECTSFTVTQTGAQTSTGTGTTCW